MCVCVKKETVVGNRYIRYIRVCGRRTTRGAGSLPPYTPHARRAGPLPLAAGLVSRFAPDEVTGESRPQEMYLQGLEFHGGCQR
jgi:hypothetical protein